MERDFLGLNSSEQLVVVKEEIIDEAKDSDFVGFTKGSGMQWPFLNKVPALPHFMSFKAAQEDKSKRVAGADAFDPSHKRPTGEGQKTFNHNRQGGTHFSMTSYPVQPEAHTIHRPHDAKMLPVSNISLSMSNPFFKTHFSGSTGQNLAGATSKQQLVGGVPVTAAHPTPPSAASIAGFSEQWHNATSQKQQLVSGIPVKAAHPTLPSAGSVAGFTELWNNAKASGSPAQLTIFYAGTVNVYDDISPEKAQAIMFLAGNGSTMASNAIHQRSQFHLPSSKVAASDGVMVNQTMNTPPTSGLSSPMSVSSHTGAQSGCGSNSNNELLQAKTTGVSVTPVARVDTPKIVNSLGPVTAATMLQSAVPQARKASLARFLEKRKERVMNAAAPYDLSRKSPEWATPGSNGINVNVSPSSGVGCGSI